MITLRARRFAAVVALSAFALLAAACGSSTTSTESAASSPNDADTESEAVSDEEASDDEPAGHDADNEHSDDSEHSESDEAAGHDHDHGAMIEVDAAVAPTVAIEVVDDPKSGFNVAVTTTNFTVSPENASSDHVDGEGHMHLLVDGEKQGRFYNDWIHVDGLDAGEHTIEVELNANTHAPYAVDGERIAAAETVTAPEAAGHSHGGTDTVEVIGDDAGLVSLELFDDPRGGWNFEVQWADGFTVSPQNASTSHVDGEGHLHLLIDGVRQGRIYGNWFYVPDQGPGEHTITVQLSTNDHRDYVLDGEPVALERTVGEPGGEPEAPTDAVMVMVDLADGQVTIDANGSDSDRVEVEQGQNVRLMISSDVAELVHVHGYNLFVELVPGETAILDFVAEAPGLFEVELEESGKFLFELSTK